MTREELEKAKDLLDEIEMYRDHKELLDTILNNNTDWSLDFRMGVECVPLYKTIYGDSFMSIYKKALEDKIKELNREFDNL